MTATSDGTRTTSASGCGEHGQVSGRGAGTRSAPGGDVETGQRLERITTVRTGEDSDGWLCPMSSYPHDL